MDASEPVIVMLAKTAIGLIVGGVLKEVIQAARKGTKDWIAKYQELKAMDERDQEVAQTEAQAPVNAEIVRLEAELSKERERAAKAEWIAEENARDLDGLGEDMRRLAADKALAEQERDAAIKRAAEAESEAEEWKRLLEAADERAGRVRKPAKETYAEVPSGEPRTRGSADRAVRDPAGRAPVLGGVTRRPPPRDSSG